MSPRRADPKLADRRKEALERAGYAEILEKGIQGTTLDSVVARAGSSHADLLERLGAHDLRHGRHADACGGGGDECPA